jgi:hypothetical protein
VAGELAGAAVTGRERERKLEQKWKLPISKIYIFFIK